MSISLMRAYPQDYTALFLSLRIFTAVVHPDIFHEALFHTRVLATLGQWLSRLGDKKFSEIGSLLAYQMARFWFHSCSKDIKKAKLMVWWKLFLFSAVRHLQIVIMQVICIEIEELLWRQKTPCKHPWQTNHASEDIRLILQKLFAPLVIFKGLMNYIHTSCSSSSSQSLNPSLQRKSIAKPHTIPVLHSQLPKAFQNGQRQSTRQSQ